MSKKDKRTKEPEIENYYDLKTEKIDELVAILKDEDYASEVEVDFGMNTNMGVNDKKNLTRSGKEKKFDPYKTDFLGKVPVWLRALFVKFWFAGAVCFFIMWGIGLNDLDAIVLVGVVLGIVEDILVNPLFKFMESDKHEFDAYIMFPFPFKAIWTFFANLLYYLIVVMFVNYGYFLVNEIANLVNGTQGLYYVGVEPILFGVFTFIVDMVFIGIKDGIVALVRHLKNRKKESAVNV